MTAEKTIMIFLKIKYAQFQGVNPMFENIDAKITIFPRIRKHLLKLLRIFPGNFGNNLFENRPFQYSI